VCWSDTKQTSTLTHQKLHFLAKIWDFNGSERYRATNKLQEKHYELQILNTKEEDLGLYVCEAQLDSVTTETTVILRLAEKII
jgi:hypothetical protein